MKNLIFAIIFVGVFATGNLNAAQNATQTFDFKNSEKIDSLVKSRFASEAHPEVLIYFADSANLSTASLLMTREARGRFVFDSLRKNAISSQATAVSILKKAGISFKAFYVENAVLVKGVNFATLKLLAQLNSIERITVNSKTKLKPVPFEEETLRKFSEADVLGHLARINAHRVWNELGVKGKGIVIGGHDTGYYWQHNSIRRQYRGNKTDSAPNHNYNWHDAFSTTSAEPFDDGDHGTHTMGTMVGDDGGTNKIGVAPEAQWIGCRNMKDGVGTIASYMECFEFFLAPYPIGGNSRTDGRPELAPHIVNNSWACSEAEGCRGDELLKSVQALKAAGIINIVAAGNEGPFCGSVASPPATYSADTVTVGAYNRYTTDAAIFSSRGPAKFDGGLAPMLMAYGEIIRSSVTGSPNRYDDKSGTSMASPQVAGVVALLWSARPELIGQIDRTIDILRKSAQPLQSRESCGGVNGSQIPNHTFGYGMVDAFKAINTP